MDGAGGFLSGFGGGDRLEEVQFYRALRLGNNGADGLPQADVAVVGGMGVRAAAVGVGVAAEDGQQGDACFVGRLKKAGFKGEDAAAFGAGAFWKEGYGVAVLQGFGNAAAERGVVRSGEVAVEFHERFLQCEKHFQTASKAGRGRLKQYSEISKKQ